MESEQEKRIREFWESLTPESLENLLKEITEAPIFIDSEKVSKARKTRKKKELF
jgi:hypothetical protein